MYLYEILKTTADMLADKNTEAAKKIAEFADSLTIEEARTWLN